MVLQVLVAHVGGTEQLVSENGEYVDNDDEDAAEVEEGGESAEYDI